MLFGTDPNDLPFYELSSSIGEDAETVLLLLEPAAKFVLCDVPNGQDVFHIHVENTSLFISTWLYIPRSKIIG